MRIHGRQQCAGNGGDSRAWDFQCQPRGFERRAHPNSMGARDHESTSTWPVVTTPVSTIAAAIATSSRSQIFGECRDSNRDSQRGPRRSQSTEPIGSPRPKAQEHSLRKRGELGETRGRARSGTIYTIYESRLGALPRATRPSAVAASRARSAALSSRASAAISLATAAATVRANFFALRGQSDRGRTRILRRRSAARP